MGKTNVARDEMITNKFAILLAEKIAREHKRISVNQVAIETGISPGALGEWYRNTVTRFDAPVINALCKYFDCKIEDLIEYLPDQGKGEG